MAQDSPYQPKRSMVEVTLVDGTIQIHHMDAGISLSNYLAEQMAQTGTLTLLDYQNGTSANFPADRVRGFHITEVDLDQGVHSKKPINAEP